MVAPDQRGGGAERPGDVDACTILHLVGDVVALIAALGEREAVVVGHDWGAPVAWLTEADVDAFAEQYRRNGFTGGLNWYRNIDRNWELTAPWQGAVITPPALYVTGDRDLVRGFYPPGFLERLAEVVPDLRAVHDLPGCGHWTQQERPDEVNSALLEFLAGL